jgi:AcrR family transcriptional regulator
MSADPPLGGDFKPRLTQDERSAETRRRLLDAAIVSLIERGYANTTTSEIAERAGLSRGAQLYHFPRKEELLASAVERLIHLRLAEIREKVSQITSQRDRRAATIDLLWEMCSGRLASAWTELVVASRTDTYLREAVRAAGDRLNRFIADSFAELFPEPPASFPQYDLVPFLVMYVISGMSIEGKTADPALVNRILQALKTISLAS